MKKLFIILALLSFILIGCGDQLAETDASGGVAGVLETVPAEGQSLNNNETLMPTMIIDQNKTYTAVLRTEAGDMEISLNAKDTPITVNNFVFLAKNDFYNNTTFHRIIPGFMIQGGDPKGDGTGGPGYTFEDEEFSGEYARGAVAMANAGPNTNGSQFFIMHADNDLPKDYVIFGKVVNGLDVLDRIAEAPAELNGMGEKSKPVDPLKINSVEIIEQ